jgi:hypothetical protein
MIFSGEFERGEGKTGRVYEGRNFREIGGSAAGFLVWLSFFFLNCLFFVLSKNIKLIFLEKLFV